MNDAERYERYKAALRRGHVALLRDDPDAALAAYDEAISIVPDRAMPHAGRGSVLLRLGRPRDAAEAFSAGLALSPRDEACLRGGAEALAASGNAVRAANLLDVLSELRASEGRTADALEAAAGALRLAESRARRREVERLLARTTEAGAPADAGTSGIVEIARRLLGFGEGEPDDGAEGEAAPVAPVRRRAATRPGGLPAVDPAILALEDETVAAEAAADAGSALRGWIELARRHAADGRSAAALDACNRALSVAPDHPALHLLLVELYSARGWASLAEEKLRLVERLAAIDRDASTLERVRDLRAAGSAG